jgi:hypothetical protein
MLTIRIKNFWYIYINVQQVRKTKIQEEINKDSQEKSPQRE